MTTIETQRTRLRPFYIEDAEDVYDYARHDSVGPMAGWQPHQSVEESRNIVETFVNNDEVFAITWKQTGRVIGSIGIHRRHPDSFNKTPGEREIGYVLHPDYWGQGIMPEVVEAIIAYGFTELEVPILWCGHYEGNHKSKRVIEKTGFAFRMINKKWHHGKNEIVTVHSYCRVNPNPTEEELLESTLNLIDEAGVHAAYTYLEQKGKERQHWSANGYNVLYCLATADGEKEKALDWLSKAIEKNDYWYRPEVFEDEDLESLFGDPRFESLKQVSKQRYDAYKKTADYVCKTQDKGNDRLLMVLHGNQQNNEDSKKQWSTLNEPLNIAYLQSKVPDVTDFFRWEEDGEVAKELAKQFHGTDDHQYNKRYLGGFSAGCQVILRALVEEQLEVDGIILVAPWIPIIDEALEALVTYIKDHSIPIAIYWGELDTDCRGRAKELYKACESVGVRVQGGSIAHTGHAYPRPFNDAIDAVIRQWNYVEPFELIIGEQTIEANRHVNRRQAVRAVIHDGKQLLMVHNVGGDFKFPGGGIESGESHEEALAREIAEETGYSEVVVDTYLGHAVSRYRDQEDPTAYFEMDSYYYTVQLKGNSQEQALDDYEKALAFTPVFCPIEDALRINKAIVEQGNAHQWVEREIRVLEELRRYL